MTGRRLRARWFVATRRAHNRWLDLRGRLAGYCMASTWRVDPKHGPGYAPGYAPGYSHWRCWRKRHPLTEPHRFINYIWSDGGPSEYDPLPLGADANGVRWWAAGDGRGNPPRWGKHHGLSTRRRDRLQSQYLQARGLAKSGKGQTSVVTSPYEIQPDPLSDESLDNVGMCNLAEGEDCLLCGHYACAICPACLTGELDADRAEMADE